MQSAILTAATTHMMEGSYTRDRFDSSPVSGYMTRTVLILIHNIELHTILRLPLHVLEEVFVDEHLQRADDAWRQD